MQNNLEPMKKLILFFSQILIILLITTKVSSQTKPAQKVFTYRGEIKDEAGMPILGASVKAEETGRSTLSDSNGLFNIELMRGTYNLKISCIGYYNFTHQVNIPNYALLKVELIQQVRELQQLEVSDQSKDKNINSTQQGTNRMTINTIKKLPTLLGEVDVIRSLQTLPGVTTVGEGSNGFNVRGGNVDQNLILMDDIPIFNSSHLLGFYSVFNPDVVRDMTLYRGGVPSTYGGRAASVLDIKLKEPNWDSTQITGGIGILASRFMIESPIKKDKISFLLGVRASYTDILFPLLNDAISNTKANYYDLTGKLRFKINNKNQLFLTGYFSEDNFKVAGDSLANIEVNASSTLFKWQTQAMSLKWNHIYNSRFIGNTSLIYSYYAPKMEIPDTSYAANFTSDISQTQIKTDLKYYKSTKNSYDFGLSAVLYNLNPGKIVPTLPQSNINPITLSTEKGVELSGYASNERQINSKIALTYGIRYAAFAQLGKGNTYLYEEGKPLDELTRIDTIASEANDIMKFYHGVEPRLSLKFNIGTEGSIKFGFQRMQQFIHLVSNTTSVLPTARWKISDRYIKPQVSDQLSLGYFQNFNDNTFETSIEFYYKNTENFPDYRSGVNLLLLDGVETAILQGKGRSYGAELYIRKKLGRTTGWLTYTYSRSEILVNSPYPEDKPFSGKYYPANFDKPHVLNLILNYHYNRTINFSANFTYSSGRPATFADDKFYIDGIFIPNFTNRNLDRIPDYHRLDLSINIEPKPNKTKRFSSSWNISVYNAYGRRNAYSVFARTKNSSVFQVTNRALAYSLSVIGTIVPSVTWNFKW
jgi:ferric enterobactin receptor